MAPAERRLCQSRDCLVDDWKWPHRDGSGRSREQANTTSPQCARELDGHMLRQCLSIALVSAFTTAGAASIPMPPAWLAGYIVKGALSYSNVEWARRRWSPDPKDQLEWRGALDWSMQVKAARASEIADDLGRVGVARATLVPGCYENEVCHQLEDMEESAASFSDWNTFNAAVQEATPYIEGYRYAIETTAHVDTQDPNTTLHDKLVAALALDQTNMIGLTGFNYPERQLPVMSAPALAVFKLALLQLSRDRFKTNAHMLEAVIAAQGWPKRSQIGDAAENAAWILVQHADYDPLLQYKALQLIEVRVKEGEADPKNAAYLHDRVMLKLTGKQRYGTQLQCRNGKLQPQPLDDADHVDLLRKDVNLPPLGKYMSMFSPNNCRTDPASRR